MVDIPHTTTQAGPAGPAGPAALSLSPEGFHVLTLQPTTRFIGQAVPKIVYSRHIFGMDDDSRRER